MPRGGKLTVEADRKAVLSLEDTILTAYGKALIERQAKMKDRK